MKKSNLTCDTVITDELRSFIGLESNQVTYDIERHAIERFACAIGDPNPLYTDYEFAKVRCHGNLIAPPTFYRSLLPGRYPKPYPEPFAHILDGGSDYKFNAPVKVGDQITVVRKVTNLYEKHGRMGTMLFKISEIRYTNQQGRLAATQTTTTITYGTGKKDNDLVDH